MESNGTTTKQKEQSSEHNSTEKKNGYNETSSLVSRRPIEGTPFTMIRQTMDNDKNQYFIIMGDHRLTEPSNTEEFQLQLLTLDKWKIIVNVIAVVVEKTLQLKQQPYETESL